jgi:hypothetical protein
MRVLTSAVLPGHISEHTGRPSPSINTARIICRRSGRLCRDYGFEYVLGIFSNGMPEHERMREEEEERRELEARTRRRQERVRLRRHRKAS